MNQQFSLRKIQDVARATITIMQIRSGARSTHNKVATLIGLGLGRLYLVRVLEDTPAVRGMIDNVSELVVVLAYGGRQVVAAPARGRTLPHKKYRNTVGKDSVNRNLSALEDAGWQRKRPVAAAQKSPIRPRPPVRDSHDEKVQNVVTSSSRVGWGSDEGIAEAVSNYAEAMERYMSSRHKELRTQVVRQSEKLIDCMYHGEPAAARRAAYGLLAASRNYRDPKLPPTLNHELSDEQNRVFKNRLRTFLEDTGKPLIVDVKAHVASASGDELIIEVDAVAKRYLPFDIADEHIFLRRDKFADKALRVTCVGARAAREKTVRTGEADLRTVMEFTVDKQIAEKGLKIVVQSGGFVEPVEIALDQQTTPFDMRAPSAAR